MTLHAGGGAVPLLVLVPLFAGLEVEDEEEVVVVVVVITDDVDPLDLVAMVPRDGFV